jgi:hypothetical protein
MVVNVQSEHTALLVIQYKKSAFAKLTSSCVSFFFVFHVLHLLFVFLKKDWYVNISSEFTWYWASYWRWGWNQIMWYKWQEDVNFCSNKSCFSLYKNYFGTIIINISCECGKDFLVVQTAGLKLPEWKFLSCKYMYWILLYSIYEIWGVCGSENLDYVVCCVEFSCCATFQRKLLSPSWG